MDANSAPRSPAQTSGDHSRRATLSEWHGFVTRESHVLLETPSVLWQQAANALQSPSVRQRAWELLAAGGWPDQFWLRRLGGSRASAPLLSLPHPVRAVPRTAIITGDGQLAIGGGRDIKIVDAATGREIVAITFADDEPMGLEISGDSQSMLVRGKSSVRVIDLRSFHETANIHVHAHAAAFLPSGELAIVEADRVTIQDVVSRTRKEVLSLGVDIRAAVVTRRGDTFALLTTGGLFTWRPGTVPALARGANLRPPLAISPDGHYVFGGSTTGPPGSIVVWDALEGRLAQVLDGHRGNTEWPASVEALTTDARGRLLASGGSDKVVCIWSIPHGERLAVFEGHSHPVTSLAFAPDSSRLVSTSFANAFIWWTGHF